MFSVPLAGGLTDELTVRWVDNEDAAVGESGDESTAAKLDPKLDFMFVALLLVDVGGRREG